MVRNLFEDLGYEFAPTSVITAEKVDCDMAGVTRMWSMSDLTESYETMTEAMDILVYVLILGAIILAVVVLYNLGVLSFTERQRELATLKDYAILSFSAIRLKNGSKLSP